MPRVRPLDASETTAEIADTLVAVEKKLGMLPNLLSTLALSPAVLNGYLHFSEVLSGGRLTALQREIIALAVAQLNECQYCLSAHTMLARNAGLTDEYIAGARDGMALNPTDAVIARFAQQVIAGRGKITDEAFDMLRAAALDDELIIEVVANVALNVLTNYVNNVVETEIDFPVVPLGNG